MRFRVPSEKKHWRNKEEIPLSGAALWTLQMKRSDVCWWILRVHEINPCDTGSWMYDFFIFYMAWIHFRPYVKFYKQLVFVKRKYSTYHSFVTSYRINLKNPRYNDWFNFCFPVTFCIWNFYLQNKIFWILLPWLEL